jgi:hypothetical protein
MKFRIPVEWTMKGVVLFESTTLKEALDKIYREKFGLPYNPEYVDGSMKVIDDELLLYNENVTEDTLNEYYNKVV